MLDQELKMLTFHNGEVKVFVTQLCPTLCELVDCSPRGSSAHGILQARILEWVAIPFFQESFQPRDEPWSPALQADSLLYEPPRKLLLYRKLPAKKVEEMMVLGNHRLPRMAVIIINGY